VPLSSTLARFGRFPRAPGAAAGTIASLPLPAVFASTQRQPVRAAVAGSVKG